MTSRARRHRDVCAIALGALVICATRDVHAQQQSNDEARSEFERGVRLMDDLRYGEAVTAFDHSLALRRTGAALYNLALAYRGLGSYRRAIATFESYIALGSEADPALVTQSRTIAEEIRGALAHVQLHVVGAATTVTADGERVGEGDGDYTLTLDPGAHTIEARRAGYRPSRERLELTAAQNAALTLDAAHEPIPPVVSLETDDAQAAIVVDHRVVGTGRWSGETTAGRHDIEIRRGGSVIARRVLVLTPGSHDRLVIGLPPSAPIYRRWWFWTGAAAIVAAGAAATVAIVVDANNVAPYQNGSLGRTW